MYISMSRLHVEVDRSDELVAAFGGRAGLVESHDGFIDLQIWRSDRDLTEVLMVSRWRDRDAFTAWIRRHVLETADVIEYRQSLTDAEVTA